VAGTLHKAFGFASFDKAARQIILAIESFICGETHHSPLTKEMLPRIKTTST
jgi:hypothetical protein